MVFKQAIDFARLRDLNFLRMNTEDTMDARAALEGAAAKRGRGGRRPGSGAKPKTLGGALKRLPVAQADAWRREIKTLALKEAKRLVTAALAELRSSLGRQT